MRHLHFSAANILGFLCVLGLCLAGCQRESAKPEPHLYPAQTVTEASTTVSTTSSTLSAEPQDAEWEQIKLLLPDSCSDHVFSPNWKWVVCRDQPNIWVAPITQGQTGTPELVAEDKPGMNFSLSGFPPERSGFVLMDWDYSSEPYTSTLWLVEPSDPSQRIRLHRASLPVSPQWSPDGKHLMLENSSGWAELVRNFGTNSQSVVPINHQLGPIVKVAWSPFGDQVFYCGQTKISDIWKLGGWILDVNSLAYISHLKN